MMFERDAPAADDDFVPVLARIEPLLTEIAARAAEIEESGEVPADLATRLGEAGAYTMYLPRRLGGEELRPIEMVQVLEQLARADGSVAWTVMVSTGINAGLGHFPPAIVAKVLEESPRARVRGAFAPKGTAEAVDGGYRVKGRWPLGSGTADCPWVICNCLVTDGGKPRLDPDGTPVTRAFLIPRAQVQFLETWDAVGMRASGSHDFEVDLPFVQEEHSAFMYGASNFSEPLHRLPWLALIAPSHAGVALGLTQGALDDLIEIARTKRPAFNPNQPIKDNPVFNYRTGELAIRLEGLRAYLASMMDENWEMATGAVAITELTTARTLAAAAFVQRECVAIVGTIFELAGSNACYRSSVLQRRWRDIRVLGQHTAAGTSFYESVAKLLVVLAERPASA